AAFSYQRLEDLQGASRAVEHTLSLETGLAQTLSLVTDAETGQRGYVITGFAQYLEPYQAALANLPAQLRKLRQLTEDNVVQQQSVIALEGLVGQKLAELEATVEARRAGDVERARQIVAGGHGQQLMVRIRTVIEQMRDEEGRLLKNRTVAQTH